VVTAERSSARPRQQSTDGKATSSTIVVGVDGSPGSLAALAWAADEALRRDDEILAVRVWHYPVDMSGFLTDASVESMQKAEEEQLELDILDVLGDDPPVKVRRLVTTGPLTRTLFITAENADLLVIGSKGHRGLTNVVIGSVSAHVTHYAPCPVVIVPQSPPPDMQGLHHDGSERAASDRTGSYARTAPRPLQEGS